MSGSYVYSAADSVTGAIFSWSLASLDFSGSGYPGPNAPVNQRLLQLTAVAGVPGVDGANGTSGLINVDYVNTSNDSLTGLAARAEGTPVAGQRWFCPNQTSAAASGIYIAASGAWTRSADMNADAEFVPGQQIFVSSGLYFGKTRWALQSGASLAATKTYALSSPPVKINVLDPRWGMLPGFVDNNTAIQAIFAYAAALSAGGVGSEIYFPAGKYYHSTSIAVAQFVSISGDGQAASFLSSWNFGGTAPMIDSLLMWSSLNGGAPHNGKISHISIENFVTTGTRSRWAAGTNFTVGFTVLPKNPACTALKLISRTDVTGAYEAIGELQPSVNGCYSKLVGTANADADVAVKVIVGGGLGVMTFQVSTTGSGGTFGSTISTAAGDSFTYIIPGFGGTYGIKFSDALGGYAAASIYFPWPRIEVIGTPPSADYLVDIVIAAIGALGTMAFQERHTQSAEKWIYNQVGAGFNSTQTTTSGAAYFDYAVPSTSLTLRFHAGHYVSNGTIAYTTPSQSWSMQVGTTIVDGGHTWQVVDAATCMRLLGRGSLALQDVTLQGGMFNLIASQSEAVHIDGQCNFQGSTSAARWWTQGDARLGEAGGFTNENGMSGACVTKTAGVGDIHDGGINFHVSGYHNYQSCPAGFAYLAGLENGSFDKIYVETAHGKTRNSCFFSRSSVGHGGIGISFGECYLGTRDICCVDIGPRMFGFEAHNVVGLTASGASIFTGVANVTDANISGSGALLVDANPISGHVYYSGVDTLQALRVNPTTALTGLGGQCNDVVISYTDYKVTSASADMLISGFSLFAAAAHVNGELLTLWNFSGKALTIQHQNAGSLAANRIATPNAVDVVIPVAPSGGYSKVTMRYETALNCYILTDWTQFDTIPINAQSGTTYALVRADAGRFVNCTNASAITVTIPHGVFAAGHTGIIQQQGAGQVTIVGGANVTLDPSLVARCRAQYSAISWKCESTGTTDVFTLGGDQG